MAAAARPGDHDRSSLTSHKETVFAMSPDPYRQDDAQSGPPMDQGSPGATRAANLLVGVTMALLLVALAVVVMLA
jgi:hypothetical protein